MSSDKTAAQRAKEKYKTTEKGKASNARWVRSPKFMAPQMKYQKKKYAEDPIFRLKTMLRVRLHKAVRLANTSKQASPIRDLGCTVTEFLVYCENHPNWQPNWTWADYGILFQIDHVKAMGLFDVTDPTQQASAVHYTNLQPLSKEDHLVKTREDVRLIKEARLY